MRVVSLYLPDWPIDRLRKAQAAELELQPTEMRPVQTEGPLIQAQRIGNRRLIYAANAAAREAGLRPGMAVAQAQALVPELVIGDAMPVEDEAALQRLGLWVLQRYSPLAAADPPEGLVLDVTGAADLHGGEQAMLTDMVTRLRAAGITARAAIADSWGAAHAFARACAKEVTIVPPGQGAAMLGALPLAFLRLPPDRLEQLRRLGLERIRDIASAARAPLTQRFGPELHRRLDQAFGMLREPIEPLRAPELIASERIFAEPISAPETLARYTGKLAAALCEMLRAKGVGVRRLDLLFHRVDGDLQAIRIGTSRPNRSSERLTRLLCDRLETIDPGFGVERMRLCASLVEPYESRQIRTTLLDDSWQADVSGLIDILTNRVGEEKLYRLVPVESDVPERSAARIAAGAEATGKAWPVLPRPVRLLRKPEPIQTVALLPDHPPMSFSWRGMRRRVRRADGPERIFGEWWKGDAERDAVRDYFQVEDDQGERFWIFRKGDGEHAQTGPQSWYLHGIFG
jgi:protein ImuB